MNYVTLGSTGLKVPRFAIGCMMFGAKSWRSWMLEEKDARPVIEKALDLGFTYFDTADQYSMGESERVVGKILRESARRDEVIVSTKAFTRMRDSPASGGLSRKHMFDAIDASLERLGLDYVDLFICHKWDYDTPIEETLETLNDIVRAGKARYVGASNYYAWQIAKALTIQEFTGWPRFVTLQNLYNLIDREDEREVIPLCEAAGIAMTPWSPLARGLLAGLHDPKYGKGSPRAEGDKKAKDMYGTEADGAIVARVIALAEDKGVKPSQIALAWLLAKSPLIVPVVGVESAGQVEDLAGVLDVMLSLDEIIHLEELYQAKSPFQDTLRDLPTGITPYMAMEKK